MPLTEVLHPGVEMGSHMVDDGWIAILHPFQQYFSHIRMIRRLQWTALCIGTPFMIEKISTSDRLAPGNPRSIGQHLSYWATGAPKSNDLFTSIKGQQNRKYIHLPEKTLNQTTLWLNLATFYYMLLYPCLPHMSTSKIVLWCFIISHMLKSHVLLM